MATESKCANIGTVSDTEGAIRNGAEGVGLYRTEFLFMDRDALPTEDEQFKASLKKRPAMPDQSDHRSYHGTPAATKNCPGMNFPERDGIPSWLALCVSLRSHRTSCIAQLWAILCASAFGKLHHMFPMIISVEEFRSLKATRGDAES